MFYLVLYVGNLIGMDDAEFREWIEKKGGNDYQKPTKN